MSEKIEECEPLEQLAAEFMDRCRTGEVPSIEAYATSHPELAGDIRELFPTIAALERVKYEAHETAVNNATRRPLELTELGEFKIVREIGRGGMGIVFEAEQESLDRRVALKVLPKQSLLDPRQLRRFQREARLAARLHHTNIVPLHGLGEYEGHHFLVMELIDGAPLDEVINRLRISTDPQNKEARQAATSTTVSKRNSGPIADMLRHGPSPNHGTDDYWHRVATIGRDAAEALQHAFEQGVLHRDIKPGNLLLDVHNNIWITDFGLAQALNSGDASTLHTLGGTLSYMPPEGFEGRFDQRSDLYSLGLTLYELLTLQPAFTDRTPAEAIKRISNTASRPLRPRQIDPTIPRDLETIVLKAAASDPARRYPTGDAFAVDLQRYLNHRPVRARKASAWRRFRLWSRRNRAVATLSAIAFGLLLATSVVTTISYLRETRSNLEVKLALLRETRERKRSQSSLTLAIEALDNIYSEFAPSDVEDLQIPLSDATAARKVPLALSEESVAILENLLPFYDQLAQGEGSEFLLQRSSTQALGRIGDVYYQLGMPEKALQKYELALSALKQLKEQNPDLDGISVEIARIHNEMGRVYTLDGEGNLSQGSHLQALRWATGPENSADEFPSRYERARACHFLGRPARIRAESVALDQLRRPGPGGTHLIAEPLALSSSNNAARRGWLHQAVAILSNMSKEQAEQPSCQFLLACTFRALAEEGPPDLKKELSLDGKQAIALLKQLVEQHPTNQHYRYELIETLRSNMFVPPHIIAGRKLTEAALRNAMTHADYLVRKHPNVLQFGLSRMHVLHKLGHVLTQRAREVKLSRSAPLLEEAITVLTAAVEQMRVIIDQHPGSYPYRLWAVVVHGSLAQAQLDLGLHNEAETTLKSAMAITNQLEKINHKSMNRSLPIIRQALDDLLVRAD
ncbi:serine/threonine protein kinase [Adhaeretor mobilis]|uniref:Serine/threonine-protein kinase PrkC n=1 Tax=Adhaeretor mobilis TaxID=1930276 RepID=A0A517MZV3_9BACT|nr:serine/threonine-protein kinase [Adhaeretor mobilis]QDT00328.1 Serine/threonine-protein kinase PrkC [Adhaeretor mobilis]